MRLQTSRLAALVVIVAAVAAATLTLTARFPRRPEPAPVSPGGQDSSRLAAARPAEERAAPAGVLRSIAGDSSNRLPSAPRSPIEDLLGRPLPLTWSGMLTRRVDSPESITLTLTADIDGILVGTLEWPNDGTIANASGRIVTEPASSAESEKWLRLGAPSEAGGIYLELTAGARRAGGAEVTGFRVFGCLRSDGTIEGHSYPPRYEVPFADFVLSLER